MIENKSATVTTIIKHNQKVKRFCHEGSKETFTSDISLW